MNARKNRDLFHKIPGLFRRYSVFAVFRRGVHFDEDRHNDPCFYSLCADRLSKAIAVDAVDKDCLSDQLSDFIALQMTDHVPSEIFRQLRLFAADLLYLVLSEIPLTGVIGFPQHLYRLGLRDAYQMHAVPVSSGPLARAADPLFNTV